MSRVKVTGAGIYRLDEEPAKPVAPTAENPRAILSGPTFDNRAWLRSKLDQYERRAAAVLDRFAATGLPSLLAPECRAFRGYPELARRAQIDRKITALRKAAQAARKPHDAHKLIAQAEQAARACDVLNDVYILRQCITDESSRGSNLEYAVMLALSLSSRFEMMVVAPFEPYARGRVDILQSASSAKIKGAALQKQRDAELFALALAQNPGRKLGDVRRLLNHDLGLKLKPRQLRNRFPAPK